MGYGIPVMEITICTPSKLAIIHTLCPNTSSLNPPAKTAKPAALFMLISPDSTPATQKSASNTISKSSATQIECSTARSCPQRHPNDVHRHSKRSSQIHRFINQQIYLISLFGILLLNIFLVKFSRYILHDYSIF